MNPSDLGRPIGWRFKSGALGLVFGLLVHTSAFAQDPISDPVYPAGLDSAMVAHLVDGHLAAARDAVERLVTVSGRRTAANTLRPFDDANNAVDNAQGLLAIATQLHPDPAVTAAGHQAEARVSRFSAEFGADPRVARAFAALDTTALTAEERLLVARVRRDYHRAGADGDEPTQQRFRALSETLDRLTTQFGANLAGDTTKVFATADELEGLPPEWIASRPRDAQGRVILTTSFQDLSVVAGYSLSRPLRRRLVTAFFSRGWPANGVVLDSLLHAREDLATQAGSRNWASYQAETRMAGSTDAIHRFLDQVRTAVEPAREQLFARYLERLRRDDSTLTRLSLSDLSLADELIRREQYDVDKREIRAYFPFARVKQGLLAVAAEFFGMEFRRVEVPVWHSSVEAYEVSEQGRLIGRFYLDLHPRPGKIPFGATYNIRDGITGRQLPEVVLIARLPGGEPGDTGLMDLQGVTGVVTLFHEFGHVMHFMLATRPYASTGGWPYELDFVEVPSTMLEEFVQQPVVLRRLSGHVETGAPIPDDLLRRIREADAFSRPRHVSQFAAQATLSLELHDRPADQANPDSLARWAFASQLGVDIDPEMHFAAAFDHIGVPPYSASYYTFLWSQAIARDLWSAFDPANPLEPRTAQRYRDTILRPGKTRPAADCVREFLGRPLDLASWQRWLEGR